jgi:hypothetical protein
MTGKGLYGVLIMNALSNDMGLRGPTAAIKYKQSEPLKDSKAPDWLGVVASEYWNRHKDYLVANGLLTAETAESFAAHCTVYERFKASIDASPRSFMDLYRTYISGSKLFRLSPTEKPGKEVETRHEDKEEW